MTTDNVKNNNEWEAFIKSEVVNFLATHGLNKIVVDDGCGKKGNIRIGSNGEYKIQVVTSDTM